MADGQDSPIQSPLFGLPSAKGVQIGAGNTQINIDHPARARGYAPVSIVPPLPLQLRDKDRRLRGRGELMEQLVTLLTRHGDRPPRNFDPPGTDDGELSRVLLLHGPPGCGKTSVAEQLAYEAGKRQVEAWWVNPVDSAAVLDGMKAVASAVDPSIRDSGNTAATPDALWECLRKRERPWLLVVDGVDDPSLLAVGGQDLASGNGWIRYLSHGPGLVIVTSRDGASKRWGDWWDRHAVGMLSPKDGALVLLDYTANRAGTESDARALAERLGGLPLALKLAGAYLALTSRLRWRDPGTIATLAAYRKALDEDQVPHLQSDEKDLDRIWRLSLDLLERRGMHHARPLMRLLSSLADAPIPDQMVLYPATLAASGLFEGLDSVGLQMTVDSLADLGLMDLTPSAGEIEADSGSGPIGRPPVAIIHPLVRYASRHFDQGPWSPASYLALAVTLLDQATRRCGDPEDVRSWSQWSTLTPHCVYILNAVNANSELDVAADDIRKAASVAYMAACHMVARELYEQAETELRVVLDVQRMLLADDATEVLNTRLELACAARDRNWMDRSQLEEAERQLRAICEARERLLANNCLDPTGKLSRLADFGWRTPDGLAVLDPDWDPIARQPVLDMLDAFHQLAVTLAYQNQSSPEAKTIYQGVYEAQRRLLGDDHPDTLASRTGLAARLYYEGRLDEAEREFRAVLEADRQLPERGDDHPDTLVDRGWLASSLQALGRLEEAEREYRAVGEALQRVLGSERRDTLNARSRLAEVLLARGRLIVGAQESQPSDMEGSVVMASHDGTASEPSWFEQALGCFQEALELTDSEKEPEFYGIILHDIAATHEAAHNLQAAVASYRESVVYKRRSGHSDIGDLATTTLALAECLITYGELAEARTSLDETNELIAQTDEEPARKAVGLHSLGMAYQRLGNRGEKDAYANALSVFRRALDLLDPEAEPGSYAAVLNRIGDVYNAQGHLENAYTAYKEAVEKIRQVSDAQDNLASMLLDLGRINRQIGLRKAASDDKGDQPSSPASELEGSNDEDTGEEDT